VEAKAVRRESVATEDELAQRTQAVEAIRQAEFSHEE
jgi:hypothetical protein